MTMGEDYRFKSYQTLLEEALADESMAGDTYRYMADVSPNASAAERLRKVAADEDRHHLVVSHLLAELSGQGETGQQYTERMEYLLGHRHPSQIGRGVSGLTHEYLVSSASFVPPGSTKWVAEEELDEMAKSIEYTILDTRDVLPLGGRMVEVHLGRPFPRTYGDWVDLAEDIKGAIGATPAGWDAINYQLQVIATGEGDVSGAKRWLVQKAGELGIR